MNENIGSLREDVEKDVLKILYLDKSPNGKRFIDILESLESMCFYEGKIESLRTTLQRILLKLKKNGVIERIEKSHKNVSYVIADRRKIRHFLYPHIHMRKKIKEFLNEDSKNSYNTFKIKNFLPFIVGNYLDLLSSGEIRLSKAIYERDEKSFRNFKESVQFLLSCYWDEYAKTLWRNSKEVRRHYKENLISLDKLQFEGFELDNFIEKREEIGKKTLQSEIKALQHNLDIVDGVRDEISCTIDLIKNVQEKNPQTNFELVEIDKRSYNDLAILEGKSSSQVKKEMEEIKKQMK